MKYSCGICILASTWLTDVAQVDCWSLSQAFSCMHITVATLTVTLYKKDSGTLLSGKTENCAYRLNNVDQLKTSQYIYQIYIKSHRGSFGLRPIHLFRVLFCVGMMALAAVYVYRFGLHGDVIQLSVESVWAKGHSAQQMLL